MSRGNGLISGPLEMSEASLGMARRSVRVRAPDVVYLKGIIEASEGLAAVFADRGGDLVIAAPQERAAELDELLRDMTVELGARVAPC